MRHFRRMSCFFSHCRMKICDCSTDIHGRSLCAVILIDPDFILALNLATQLIHRMPIQNHEWWLRYSGSQNDLNVNISRTIQLAPLIARDVSHSQPSFISYCRLDLETKFKSNNSFSTLSFRIGLEWLCAGGNFERGAITFLYVGAIRGNVLRHWGSEQLRFKWGYQSALLGNRISPHLLPLSGECANQSSNHWIENLRETTQSGIRFVSLTQILQDSTDAWIWKFNRNERTLVQTRSKRSSRSWYPGWRWRTAEYWARFSKCHNLMNSAIDLPQLQYSVKYFTSGEGSQFLLWISEGIHRLAANHRTFQDSIRHSFTLFLSFPCIVYIVGCLVSRLHSPRLLFPCFIISPTSNM